MTYDEKNWVQKVAWAKKEIMLEAYQRHFRHAFWVHLKVAIYLIPIRKLPGQDACDNFQAWRCHKPRPGIPLIYGVMLFWT